MANTVYGPFSAINVVNGSTPANATWGNNVQTQASVALNGINPDLSGPFVLSGCAASGTVGTTTVNIASGTAYVKMSDGTTGKIAVGAATQTTSALSSTYNLYLQPDGTFYWSTSNTPAANSLYLATVATNGSGQISTITDLRHTSGSPGVPIVVARVLNQHVTSTADALPVNLSGVIQGLYRATVTGFYGNGTTGGKITVSVAYTSANVVGTPTMYFMTYGGGAAGVVGEFLNGSQTTGFTTNSDFACSPIDFYVGAGGLIRVHYIDPAGTPNDYVTVLIQRMA